MYELPISLKIGEKQFNITNRGDYRMVLDCFNALNDNELTEQEQIVSALLIFYEDITGIDNLFEVFDTEESLGEAIQQMFLFFNCGQEHIGMESDYTLVDWDKDEQIIVAAVNTVANKEVRLEPYIHWWTFMGYYISIGESVLSTVVGIRYKIVKQKKLEKEEKEFRRDNPHYFDWNFMSSSKQKMDELIKDIWNKE